MVPVGRSRKDRETGVGVVESDQEPLQVKELAPDEPRRKVVTLDGKFDGGKLGDEKPITVVFVCPTEVRGADVTLEGKLGDEIPVAVVLVCEDEVRGEGVTFDSRLDGELPIAVVFVCPTEIKEVGETLEGKLDDENII